MMDPSILFQIKGLWDKFTREHPKFPMFLKAVSKNGIKENALIEIKITTPDGEELQTNIKVTAEDLELFDKIRQMNA